MNHGWTYLDKIAPPQAGLSALDFYAGRYRHSTRGEWRRRLGRGEITRRGAALAPESPLAAGDLLEWRRPPWEEGPVPTDYKVVYEDDALVAVDKPAGLPVLPDGGFLENTLLHLLRLRYPGENVAPAHRLNRGASGLLLCARTPEARRDLAGQFRDKTLRRGGAMRKTYFARSLPYPGGRVGDRLEITTPVGLVPHPLLGRVHAASPGGRPSCSRCEIVAADASSTLWRVDLVTGRPHQIRIHLASVGVPLVGEPLFLPGGLPRPDALPGDCGYFLRSASLTFRHPATRAVLSLSVAPFRPESALAPDPRALPQ